MVPLVGHHWQMVELLLESEAADPCVKKWSIRRNKRDNGIIPAASIVMESAPAWKLVSLIFIVAKCDDLLSIVGPRRSNPSSIVKCLWIGGVGALINDFTLVLKSKQRRS